MRIELPQFDEPFCEFLSVCSRLERTSLPESGLPEEPFEVLASYRTPAGKRYVRLTWSHGPSYHHLHVDIGLQSAFGEKAPQTTIRLTELRKRMAPFEGSKVLARLIGFYRIPLAHLPSSGGVIFTGSNAIRLRAKRTEIELTGAQLTFREADISNLRWELVKDTVLLDMEARRELTISAHYLVDAKAVLDAALSRYVLGTTLDEKSNP
jgi:hypothetical protein